MYRLSSGLMYTREQVAGLLEADFDGDVSVQSIPNSDVYKAKINAGESQGVSSPLDSDTLYIKPVERPDRYRKLIEIHETYGVGIPRSCVVEDDGLSALVSVPAKGRVVSHLLPVYLSPGIWRSVRKPLTEAYVVLGEKIGILRRETNLGKKEADPSFLSQVNFGEKGSLFEIDELGTYLGGDVVEDIRRAFELGTGTKVDFSYSHGDVTPHNMYYQGGSVEIIDLSLNESPTVRDVANIAMSLELMACCLPYPATNKTEHLVDAFETGYENEVGGSSLACDRKMVDVTVLSFLCKAASYMLLNRGRRGPFKRLQFTWDLFWLKRLINKYLSKTPTGA